MEVRESVPISFSRIDEQLTVRLLSAWPFLDFVCRDLKIPAGGC